jgi:hypothetical protein
MGSTKLQFLSTGIVLAGWLAGCSSSGGAAPGEVNPPKTDAGSMLEGGAPAGDASSVRCRLDDDCGPGSVCAQGECRQSGSCTNTRDCTNRLVCDVSAARCVECVVDADCGANAHCSDSHCKPACASDLECTRFGLLCDAGRGVCVDCLRDADCPSDRSCAQGNCRPKVCPPNALGCDATRRQVVHCDPSGTRFDVYATCAGNQICDDGQCAAVICKPNELSCRDSTLSQCGPQGTAWDAVRQCGAAEFCDAATTSCQPRVCAAGELRCDGNNVIRCRTDGSKDELVSDCMTQSQVCSDGRCVNQICKPDALICVDDKVRRCAQDGLSLVTVKTCASEEFCSEQGGTADCLKDVCVQGQSTCIGNVAKKCNAQGSGYDQSTDCSLLFKKACYKGSCDDVVCTPNSNWCLYGGLHHCDDTGTQDTVESCGNIYACDPGGAAACIPRGCAKSTCDGETAQCATDQPVVCPADQVCSVFPGGCAAVASDFNAIGSGIISLGGLTGLFFQVNTERTLVGIDSVVFVGATPTDVHWVVYENSMLNGPYALVLDRLVSTTTKSYDVIGSGPVSVRLKKGFYYFIGLFSHGATVDQAAQYFFDTSFGQAFDYLNWNISDVPTSVSFQSTTIRFPTLNLRTTRPQ